MWVELESGLTQLGKRPIPLTSEAGSTTLRADHRRNRPCDRVEETERVQSKTQSYYITIRHEGGEGEL